MDTNDAVVIHYGKGVTRSDGWANVFTGAGIMGRDSTRSTVPLPDILSRADLINLHAGDGFGHRIIEIVCGDMTRAGFEVSQDPDTLVKDQIKRLSVDKHLENWIRWGDLFGGSVIFMGVGDGKKPEEAVNEATIRKILFLRIFDRHRVQWSQTDVNDDPMSENYGQIEFYTITPIVGTPFRVHRSRLMIYDGEPTAEDRRIANQGWGDSSLQSCYSHLRSFGQSFNSVDAILKAFVQDVIKMDGLMALVASGKEDLIRKRLNILDLSRSVLNAKLLDTKEGYEKIASSVTGIPEVLDRLAQALAAARGIPLTRLMGISPGGLNATGDSETRQWYDQVASYQENRVKPELERLIRYMFLAKETGYGSVPEGWEITFNSLWQQSDKEVVDTRKTQAETDQIYFDMGILTPEEIRESRFKDGVWTMGYDDVEGDLPETEPPEDDPEGSQA